MSTAEAEVLGAQGHDAHRRPSMLHVVGEGAVSHEVLRPVSVIYEIPTGYLNIFSQQRAGANKEQEALTNSLRGGQINPVNIVLASEELIDEYRRFTNETWGGNMQMEDLVALPLPENVHPPVSGGSMSEMYAILVAGHSRVKGKRALAKEESVNPDEATIEARVHEVTSIDQILQIQLAENIHSQPAKDRELRAVGEMFKWMDDENRRRFGRPIERRAFAKFYGVSEDTVRVAANYVELPREIRDLSDNDGLPFKIVVELARARTAIMANARYLAAREPANEIKPTMPTEEVARRESAQAKRITELELSEYGYLLAVLEKKGYLSPRNASKGCTVIKAHAKTIRDTIAGRRAAELSMIQELFTDGETLEARIVRLRQETGRNLADFVRDQGHTDRHLAGRVADLAGLSIRAARPDLVVGALRDSLELVESAGEGAA